MSRGDHEWYDGRPCAPLGGLHGRTNAVIHRWITGRPVAVRGRGRRLQSRGALG